MDKITKMQELQRQYEDLQFDGSGWVISPFFSVAEGGDTTISIWQSGKPIKDHAEFIYKDGEFILSAAGGYSDLIDVILDHLESWNELISE